jgi:hypothetical protein
MRHMGAIKALVRIVLAVCSATMEVQAAPVTLSGGFSSFTSDMLGQDFGFQTFINGSEVPVPGGLAAVTVPFDPMVSTVSFHNQTLGCKPPAADCPNTGNLIRFTVNTAPIDVVRGEEFLLGTFTYTNGIWSGDADLAFSITTQSNDFALNLQTFSDVLHLTITGNDGATPADRADFLYFAGRSDLGVIAVYELADGANTGTVDFYGKIGSLNPTRFADATGGAFIAPLPGQVDEPNSIASALLGLVSLAAISLRRSRERSRVALQGRR